MKKKNIAYIYEKKIVQYYLLCCYQPYKKESIKTNVIPLSTFISCHKYFIVA